MAFSGIDGLRAYRAMISLIYSLTQISEVYRTFARDEKIKKPDDVSLERFIKWFSSNDDAKKHQLFKIAALCGVDLTTDEVLSIVKYHQDKNGVPINKSNIGNMKIGEIVNVIADVCVDLSKEEVFF